MNRRQFLANAPIAALAIRSTLLAQAPGQKNIPLTIHPSEVLYHVAEDFMGFSYESTQLGEPEFFSPANTQLIALFRTLGPRGVLRLGGNTSEFTWFQPNPSATPPPYQPQPTQPAALIAITPHAIENLRAFLDATGWSCIYGLNLGTANPQRVVEEAKVVSRILGTRLKYFQIGNEPNNYIRYKLRPSTWNVKAYLDDWLPFAKAVTRQIPGAKVSGPDMGAEREWMETFAQLVPSTLGSSLVEMTDHFYAEGPPTSPEATIPNLFSPKKIGNEIAVMQDTAKTSRRPYRMTEVNSCYLGGKPNVSNTMAAALWAADLTLLLATSGFSGINFHGGSAKQIKSSLGGTMPGDTVSKSEASDSYYTPIAGSAASGYSARPVFYGMLFASSFAGSDLVRVEGVAEEMRAYAAIDKKHGTMQVALFNLKETTVNISLKPGTAYSFAYRQDLLAPTMDATSGLTFAGTSIGPKGDLSAPEKSRVTASPSNEFPIVLAPHSASLLTFHRS